MLIENLGENWYDDIMNDNEGIGDNYLENLEQRLNKMSSEGTGHGEEGGDMKSNVIDYM